MISTVLLFISQAQLTEPISFTTPSGSYQKLCRELHH